jgi:bacteriocin biosynthesis cyclodehydratase domain-containing protein
MDAEEQPLPDVPRLRPSVDIAPIDSMSVLVRGHRGSLLLSGAFVAEALPTLVNCLDGERTLNMLLDGVEPAFRAEAERFFRMMHARGYLLSGQGPADPAEARTVYWELNVPDPAVAAARLAAAHVVIFGAGAVGTALAASLAEAGVGRRTVHPRTALLGDAPDAACAEATVIALASDGMSLAGVDAVNALAIERGIPWMLVRIDRTRALIGPYVIPGETSCFVCYELRARANAEHPADHEGLHRHWRLVADRSADPATPPSTGPIIGGWVALDLARAIASSRTPVTAGRIVALDLHTLQSTRREILRLPRCPACSRLRTKPLTRIWDLPSSRAVGKEG